MKGMEELFLYFPSSMFLALSLFIFALKLHSSESSQFLNYFYKSEKYQKIIKINKVVDCEKEKLLHLWYKQNQFTVFAFWI